ncbi:MAG TPA: glycosyltransferase family 4 protein [Coriobacteriia bacterium]|jgi:glycosyltransferase involved in cell wall biosynthesis
MPRVLLVTYEFPPMGGVGVQRCLKFAKYLPRAGWDVSVLTVADPPTALLDESLLAELPASVRVHRAWSLEPTRLIQLLRRRRSEPTVSPALSPSSSGRAGFSGMPAWVIRVVQAFFVPDEKRLWRGPARREALSAVREDACDAVVSSGPPFTAHLVARDVARRTALPWVADFRDPWVGNYFFRPPTPLHGALQARWERRVVREAGLVVVVSEAMAEDLRQRYPDLPADHFRVIPNGFDPEDLPVPSAPSAEGPFTFAYLGVFQGAVSPDAFLAGLRRALDAGSLPADGVRVRLIGPRSASAEEAVERYGLRDLVETTGYLPHRRALAEAARAHVGLLVLPPGPRSRPILTGKLFEYLALGRAVLALVSPGDARALVEEARAGVVADPADPAAVTAAIASLYACWREGRSLPSPDPSVVARYDRRKQAAALADLIAGIAGGRS